MAKTKACLERVQPIIRKKKGRLKPNYVQVGVSSGEESTSEESFAEEDYNDVFQFGKSHLKLRVAEFNDERER